MKIYDITRTLSPSTVIYPGNPSVEFEVFEGETSTHTKVSFGTHTGTHLDAPKHVFRDGEGVDKISLDILCGECRVLDLRLVEESIKIQDLEPYHIQKGERILVRTKNSDNEYKEFTSEYTYLDGDASDWLVQKEIALFGIDYLSIKKRGGKDHRPHTSLLAKGIIIFEGLDLREIEKGEYMFVGLPLKFQGLDGSPVRAILIKK
ncbi:MAG: cyclase family protein [Candidatus Moranbacteria bacterium]|nr:cyclase family protein [Candidatus Moranbacteria bacterium]